MSSYIRMISGAAFSAVFILCVIIFATQFAADNDSDISITDDPRFTNLEGTLKNNLTTLKSNAETSQEFLFKTTLEPGDEHSSTGAQFKIGPLTAMALAISSLNVAFFTIFGVEFNFILTALITMITFILGYFTIQAWLGRNPG